ncbi:MAG: FmdB family transcriptional regulator [Actinomycetota bacterium]|nr:FmdB family transcriptional regulator [Actinomycetota bacterium]
MPKYEYVCKACQHNFEIVQSFTDDPLAVCDQCGGQLRKVFGNIGITFKGSGFYRNDARSSSSTTRPATSADSKPAATPAESAGSGSPAAGSGSPAAASA